jgi:hypothetical protein
MAVDMKNSFGCGKNDLNTWGRLAWLDFARQGLC